MELFKTVDSYIANAENFNEALQLLRDIMVKTDLEEGVKWGMPVYMWNKKNVAGFCAFKKYVGVWFYQGVFLKDEQNKLVNAQEGVTKALRQWRFNSLEEIEENEKLLLEYLKEATKNQQLGKEIKPAKPNKKVTVPQLLKEEIAKNKKLKTAFEKFTPGKQKEFCNYIIEAKRDATKQSRLQKIIPMILEGIGLNDKYR